MKIKKTKIYKMYRNIMRVEEVNASVYKLNKKIEEQNRILKEIERQNEKSLRIGNENLFATIFHDTIKNSKWFDIPLSLSSGAIGYPYAYILYRILDEIKPKKILETGLGQSTKIITEYVKYFEKDGIKHDVVEHDENWVDFFKTNTKLSDIQNIHLLKNYQKEYNGYKLNAYKNFKKEFQGKKFDLISIDGPVGYGQEYSRMDILEIIPGCLEKQFVILIDDCERIGEMHTIELLEEKLRKNDVNFHSGYQYWGRSSVYICVSNGLEFLCHI